MSETTLASRTFIPFLRSCKSKGYIINLIYLWLSSVALAIERVARRVASGGHAIPEETIRRRYERGRQNLIKLYLPGCDRWIVYENSGTSPLLVAEKDDNETKIYQPELWSQITRP